MGDLILQMIGAGFVVVVLVVIGLAATGGASVTITDPKTGKSKTWGSMKD